MEPLTTAAIAIGATIATKALEKTGENVGQAVWDKTGEFIVKLRKHSPQTVVAIEKAPDQPLDYGKAVLEVESATQANPELAQAAQELATAAKAETNPKFAEIMATPNLTKLADKIGQVVMPGGTGNIQNQSF
ncbi:MULTISPECIES: hypothetical protein [unclassified Tolypothrix]|uniref:hypothetical protein n=1 Tax=unclassified Tolypothrix TaxID=2649714 RepID=UPI0005EAC221|nr:MULTISPECIES: hypothetical protein [unclassified Tolypothrix]BAY94451.1 hypothetical protein NIES3275_64990 [Microchaete diplosiphon NIES-3275]EKF02840.1 hypothetical protein FDUTEX481_05641 [Tolypothrix sp. PCC 7601]MBE9087360.1 hypothetical protein [Tolypothrix sp. LEGE 11397]UYD28162.1 hypothetical protein HGR01_09065 [Tolypothrix sp. PCC 7712]UYD35962.1 hypothetical protein HG267_09530 [Tolypothrix sp. PCC 7601]